MGDLDPIDFINAETLRIPFKNTQVAMADWATSFRSWPSEIPGWRDWYRRVSLAKSGNWDRVGITHCLNLSLADPAKNEPLLASACYFWSDLLNAFLFNHGPMSPTLLDVVMLTDLDITSSIDPFDLRTKPCHQIPTKHVGGWGKYISKYSHTESPVSDMEHVAFLLMWLERFLFCGSTLGPTSNMQNIAESLVQGTPMPLGRYLLGATYHMLHQTARRLSAGDPAGHIGGPWWFLQLWLTVYTSKAVELPPFTDSRFPSFDFAEGEQPVHRPCISLGEAASVVTGRRLSDDPLADWFRAFYNGFIVDNRVWFAYEPMEFEIPHRFRPEQPLRDEQSKALLSAFISPCLLLTGIAPGRSQHLSYEFYHPTVSARQIGFGQLPIGLYFISRLKAREPITSRLEFSKISKLTESLPMGSLTGFTHTPFCTRLFTAWWREWKLHLFNCRNADYLTKLTLSETPEEV